MWNAWNAATAALMITRCICVFLSSYCSHFGWWKRFFFLFFLLHISVLHSHTHTHTLSGITMSSACISIVFHLLALSATWKKNLFAGGKKKGGEECMLAWDKHAKYFEVWKDRIATGKRDPRWEEGKDKVKDRWCYDRVVHFLSSGRSRCLANSVYAVCKRTPRKRKCG